MIICKNCNNTFEGHYCNHCGQKADTHRISLRYLWHEIQHGVLHLDKGVFYTVKELFIRPGYAIKEYINGKRIRHFKPFAFVFILAGILGLLRHFFHVNIHETVADNNLPDTVETIFKLAKSNMAIAQLVLLPFIASCSWIAFRKSGYNFFEHLILNTFLFGQNIAVNILFMPLGLFHIDFLDYVTNNITSVYFLILIIWGYFQFFNELNSIKTILKIILTFIIFIAETTIIFSIAYL